MRCRVMLNSAHSFVNDVILIKRPYINGTKIAEAGIEDNMGRFIKFLIYLVFLGGVALVGYAYLGPFFGVDFSAPQTEIRQPVTLDGN